MKTHHLKSILILAAIALPVTLVLTAGKAPSHSKSSAVERGKYLVDFGGCGDCHTPLKFTDQGPIPDLARLLSGHPEKTVLPPADLKPGPWFAATAGMTAWAGPWGVSYASNLTPDPNTGLGIWTEEMFLKAMKTGKHMGDGREILPPMPWRSVARLNDGDIRAIYAYLRTIPPISNLVPVPVPPGGAPKFE